MWRVKFAAYTLIEFIVSFVLSMIFLAALLGFFIHTTKIVTQQQVRNQLLSEANLISQIWQAELSTVGDYGAKNFSSIVNLTDYPLSTSEGIKIISTDHSNFPILFPKADRVKLLPHSFIIMTESPKSSYENAVYDAKEKVLYTSNQTLIKDDLALITNGEQSYLMQINNIYKVGAQKKIIINNDFFSNASKPIYWKIASWQITFWYIMKNNTHEYGLYRIQLPHETTPVEIISDVKNFSVMAYQNHQWIEAKNLTDWSRLDAIRLYLVLAKDQQQLCWPISVVFWPKVLGVRRL